MSFTVPTPAQFQAFFTREFPYGSGPDTVTQQDIQRAIDEAQTLFRSSLWNSSVPAGYVNSEANIAYFYLSAHLLTLSLQNSGGLGAPGLSQGALSSGGGVVSSKTVGSVTVNYQLPEFVTKSPTLSQFMRTGFGQKYVQMLAPKIPGARVQVVGDEPTPDIILQPNEVFNPLIPGPTQS